MVLYGAGPGAYLSGRETIPTPGGRHVPDPSNPSANADNLPFKPAHWLTFNRVTKHNLHEVTIRLPLQRLVCLSGVSGSGKSTLLDHVIHQGLLTQRHQLTVNRTTALL